MKKDKKKSKGFTLIELLAVVVILLAISVMAISSISAAVERNKTKQNEAKIKVIESYAELYYDENKNSLTDSNAASISIGDLELTEEEGTDADGEPFVGKVCICDSRTFKFANENKRQDCHSHDNYDGVCPEYVS